jgi:hypothetical protein
MFGFFSRLIKNSGNKQVLLGRWNSINKEEVKNKNIVWSNYDNCFTSIIYKKKCTNSKIESKFD